MNSENSGRSKAQTSATYILLHGKYFVLRELLDSVRHQLGDVRRLLEDGEERTARLLCGNPYWQLLDRSERRLAGSCLSHMVRTGGLPLVQVNRPGCYPNRYALQNSRSTQASACGHTQSIKLIQ